MSRSDQSPAFTGKRVRNCSAIQQRAQHEPPEAAVTLCARSHPAANWTRTRRQAGVRQVEAQQIVHGMQCTCPRMARMGPPGVTNGDAIFRMTPELVAFQHGQHPRFECRQRFRAGRRMAHRIGPEASQAVWIAACYFFAVSASHVPK